MLPRFFFTIIALSILGVANAQSKQIIIHDPVAAEADGKFYIFGTGPGVESAVSDDAVNWTKYNEPTLNPIPDWCKEEVPNFDGHIWAPDIAYHKGKYYLYYSISSFGSNLSCIGVATNTTLNREDEAYKWEDHGIVLKSIPGRDNWNGIDPNLIFDENNQPWLSFGSFWGGLKIFKLSDDLLRPAKPEEWYTIAARDRDVDTEDSEAGSGAVEGPFIFKKGDFYYLFVSFDLCCRGENSTYHVRVGRSKSVIGPYLDKDGISMNKGGGTLVVKGDDEDYFAIGHNSVYTFDGTDYMYSHGYDIKDKGLPKLVVHQISWDAEGWPVLQELKNSN